MGFKGVVAFFSGKVLMRTAVHRLNAGFIGITVPHAEPVQDIDLFLPVKNSGKIHLPSEYSPSQVTF